MRNTPQKKVLIIGKVEAMGERIASTLKPHGINALATTLPKARSGIFDASGFDLITFGGGVEPIDRRRLAEAFSIQNPNVKLLDVFAPVAAEQIIQALQGEADEEQCASGLILSRNRNRVSVRVHLIRTCRIRVEVYHLGDQLNGRTLVNAEHPAGDFTTFIEPQNFCKGSNMVLVILNGSEFHIEKLTW